jgi:outer membrane receptor protein involved in Fe transport
VAALALTSPANAQQITATLRGKVIDTDGTGIPSVPVRVSSNTHGSAGRTVVTDIEGRFRFQLLPPANDYMISVDYPGFARIEVGPIDLDPGKTTVQDVTLRSSSDLTETIEVVVGGRLIDTESTVTSSVFNTEFIEGLPIIGRSFQDILTLTPGVTDTDGDGNPNVQGARETGLQIRLDGGNITDPVSGTFGQNLNLDAIEEIEVITSGASAEFGRADGGFANIITKSGGNDFEGTARLIWRGKIFDGDGATENQDTFLTTGNAEVDLRDTRPFLTLGGALLRDKLWYFTSLQYIDTSIPQNLAGASITQSTRGSNKFGKLTWQVNSDNKLALQFSDDPLEIRGLFVGFGTDEDSDGTWQQGGQTAQLRWTSILSPTLLMETLLTSFDSGISIDPVASDFHVTRINTRVNRKTTNVTLQAEYPIKECSSNGTLTGFIPNCSEALGDTSIQQFDLINGTTTGPLAFASDDRRVRNSIKSDLTYTLEDAWGEHQIKSGLEFADEAFENEPINNPFFVNLYEPCGECRDVNGQPIPNAVKGAQILTVPTPVQLDQKATSFNSAAYLTDTWKPVPNLTVNIGVRIDREDVDTSGFSPFDPRQEKRNAISIVEGLCADGLRVSQSGSTNGANTADTVCDLVGRLPGTLPTDLTYTFDGDSPESLRRWDIDNDGIFNSAVDRIDGLPVWASRYTDFSQRSPENFEISNLNLSPRFSVSWDPWADGKTKVFSTWGRFYDRLFLATVSGEIGPDQVNYVFQPDSQQAQFLPGQLSNDTSAVSVQQVDRGLRTPFTDVFTIGFEREIAPEWSARVTYTQRLGWDLLQDQDYNHILCTQHEEILGISPSDVCPLFTDTATGKVVLGNDQFGTVGTPNANGAPDLYNVNPNFNQVLRVGNFNSSRFKSIALELNKRLHRNWQMQTSYTFSRAEGQAEAFAQALGNDPSTIDDENGYLAFDQRHRVVVIATSRLPRDVEVGTTVTWESGTPFSLQAQTVDQDDVGNTVFRTFFPSGQRNDQRNDGFWGLDAKITKRFMVGKAQASAELSVRNLLNDDDLTLAAFRSSSFSGVQLQGGPQGLRRFGRFWEVGVSMAF